MGQFHWDPDGYLQLMRSEVPAYERLQDEVARASEAVPARSALELGTGTGITARRVLARHPGVRLTGIDASAEMLGHAQLTGADLRVQDLGDPLPDGAFDLVFSALAVHPSMARARRTSSRASPPCWRRAAASCSAT